MSAVMDRQKEFVLRDLRRARHPIRSSLVHRRPGISEIRGDRARRRVLRGYDFSTARPSKASPRVVRSRTPLAQPDPHDVPDIALARRCSSGRHDSARMLCDIATPDETAPAVAELAARAQASPARAKAADAGFTCYAHPEIEFYLLTPPSFGPRRSRHRSTRPATSTTVRAGRRARLPVRRHAMRGAGRPMGSSRRVQRITRAARVSSEIDLRYAPMRPRHGGQRDDVPAPSIKEVAIGQGVYLGDVHAEAPVSDHAGQRRCTRSMSAVRGRRGTPSTTARARSASCRRRRRQFIAGILPTPRRRDRRRVEPVGELLQAADGAAGRRRPRPPAGVGDEPLGARPGLPL